MNVTTNCSAIPMANVSSGPNTSNLTCPQRQPISPRLENPFLEFYKYAFASSIYIIIVSFVTIVANSLLLLVLIVDPLKTFRNPTTMFLIGLAIVDLSTALITEPFHANCFMMMYFGHPKLVEVCTPLFDVAQSFGAVTMTTSFIIIFTFTTTQYIVITSPLKYAPMITKRRAILCVFFVYVYTNLFWTSMYYAGADATTLSTIDLFLHSMFISYITIVLYILLYRTFKRKMAQRRTLQSESSQHGSKIEHKDNIERKFISLNFLLLLNTFICSQPSIVIWFVMFARKDLQGTPNALIAHLMADNMLFLKFMLDPFMYAWRLPIYREALKKILRCGSKKQETRSRLEEISVNRMAKSTDTVVTVGFRSIAE